MADSLLISLYSLLDPHLIESVARSWGMSDVSSLKRLRSGIATVLEGMIAKSTDESRLRALLRLSPKLSLDISLTRFANDASNLDSRIVPAGERILSVLFGPSQTGGLDAAGGASGLPEMTSSRSLAIAAWMVVSYIANRVHAEGMSVQDLKDLLQRESECIRAALPSGREDAGNSSEVIASPVERKQGPTDWLPLLVLAVLMLSVMWLFSHARGAGTLRSGPVSPESKSILRAKQAVSAKQPTIGTADRPDPDPVDVVKGLLLNTVDLRFDTASARLQPATQGQLDMIAATIAAYPDVHLTLTGHTDNTGSAQANRRLSHKRAKTVMAELIRKGVLPDHLSSYGESEQASIADNSTEEGRARNRCVTLEVSPH